MEAIFVFQSNRRLMQPRLAGERQPDSPGRMAAYALLTKRFGNSDRPGHNIATLTVDGAGHVLAWVSLYARMRNSETIKAAVALFSTWSRQKIFFRWVFTVSAAIPKMIPISSLVLPLPSQYSTSVVRAPNARQLSFANSDVGS